MVALYYIKLIPKGLGFFYAKRKGGVMELENMIAAARGIKPTAQRNANEKIKRSRIIGYDRLQYGLTFKEVFYFVASIMALGMVMHFYSSI